MLLSDGKKKKAKDTLEESDEEPVDVLVDTIIGFLEKSTAYMRTIGNQVFSLLSGSIKESTIDLIVTVSFDFSILLNSLYLAILE